MILTIKKLIHLKHLPLQTWFVKKWETDWSSIRQRNSDFEAVNLDPQPSRAKSVTLVDISRKCWASSFERSNKTSRISSFFGARFNGKPLGSKSLISLFVGFIICLMWMWLFTVTSIFERKMTTFYLLILPRRRPTITALNSTELEKQLIENGFSSVP